MYNKYVRSVKTLDTMENTGENRMKKHMIITIARQSGSGGREIGERLAEKLGIPCYGKELTRMAAENSGLSEEILRTVDERATHSFLYSLAADSSRFGSSMPMNFQLPINDKLFRLQSDLILEIARRESAIFIGRCADYVLREDADCLRVFIYADAPTRVARIRSIRGVSENEAKEMITKTDKQRANYYNYYTSGKWGKSEHYDLMLNTTRLGVQGSVDLIASCAESWHTK